MKVCVPVTDDGQVAERWGRADRLAVAEVVGRRIIDWQEIDVGWGDVRDQGTEGAHHARVARFLRDHHVEAVVAPHMGPDMQNMLQKMGLRVELGAAGNAGTAVLAIGQ